MLSHVRKGLLEFLLLYSVQKIVVPCVQYGSALRRCTGMPFINRNAVF